MRKDITEGIITEGITENEEGLIELTDEIIPPIDGSKKDPHGLLAIHELKEREEMFYPPKKVTVIAKNGMSVNADNYIKGERTDDDYKHVMKVCLPDNKPIRKAIDAAEEYIVKKESKIVSPLRYLLVFLLGVFALALATM
jgi:hypothetical protein